MQAEVFGREKKPFAVWRKMEEKKEGFSRLSDIYGFRIITRSVGDCYIALGAVHRRWAAVPGRFKDYISQPKSNGYRSIHTTVSGRDGKRVEVQIRTAEMHAVAETGVAAHWSYKDGERFENPFAVDPFKWLSAITERFETAEDSEDFLEHVKLEMFQDQVFCFTPKGDVVKLPRGATPIDFAYAIHTRIGDQLRRRQGRRAAGAALDQAPQRPVGDDHPRRGPAAAALVGGHGGHRPRQGGDPALACAASSARPRCGSGARSRGWRWSGSARRRPTRRWRRPRAGSGSRRPTTCWRASAPPR